MGQYSRRVWACPYYRSDEAKAVRCVGGKISFRSLTLAKEYFDRHCANAAGWEGCAIAKALNEAYEREQAKKSF